MLKRCASAVLALAMALCACLPASAEADTVGFAAATSRPLLERFGDNVPLRVQQMIIPLFATAAHKLTPPASRAARGRAAGAARGLWLRPKAPRRGR